MKTYFLRTLLLFLFPLMASSQKNKSDKGILYCTLGNDTTLIQSFELSNNTFKTTFILFTGAITKCEATGTLDANGDLLQVTSSNYKITDAGNWELTTTGVNNFTGDSSVYIATNPKGEIVTRHSFPGIGIVANGMDIASFFNFAYMGFYAPANAGDTLFHRQLSFNGVRKFAMTRKSKTELRIGSTLTGNLSLMVDKKNRLQKIEGVGSSLNIRATIERKNINTAVLDEIAKRRNSAGAATVKTLRDTARVTLNNNIIEVDYWRPHKRGREIFGNVVPWNRAWRTGANNATQLRFSNEIIIGGNKLPAGKYGIWSYPTENKWELIINKNANAWGTDYDPAADIFRVPLTVEKLTAPVEVLTISFIKKEEKKAVMVIEWDVYKASIEITTD